MPTAYYPAFLQALEDAILAEWTELATADVYEAIEFARLSLGKKATDLPVAVVDIDLRGDADWGVSSRVEEGVISIGYLATDATSLTTITAKVEGLRIAMYDSGLDRGQVIGWPSITRSLNNPLNRLFVNFQRPFVWATLEMRVLVGETT